MINKEMKMINISPINTFSCRFCKKDFVSQNGEKYLKNKYFK